MGRAILDIAAEACMRDGTAPPPKSLFDDNNNRIARILRIAAHDLIREYLSLTSIYNVSEFRSTWGIVLVPGRFSYELPPDFNYTIPGTQHVEGQRFHYVGDNNLQAYAHMAVGATGAQNGGLAWQIRNNAIEIFPTPNEIKIATIDYVSRYPVVGDATDEDVDPGNPFRTIAPVVPLEGATQLNEWSTLLDEMTNYVQFDKAGFDSLVWEAPSEPSNLSILLKRRGLQLPDRKVRRAEFKLDTDEPAFADTHLLSLGLTFHLRRALGLEYSQNEKDYRIEFEAKAATDSGTPRAALIGEQPRQPDYCHIKGNLWMVS